MLEGSVVLVGEREFVIGGNPFAGKPAVRLDDATYRLFCETRPRACMDLVFVRPDGRILIGLRKYPPVQDWLVVGGYRVAGQTRNETAVRIAQEEMGFRLDPSRPVVWIEVYEYIIGEGEVPRHDVTPTYTVAVTDDEADSICLRPEHFDDQRWIDPNEITGHPERYHPTLVQIAKDYLNL